MSNQKFAKKNFSGSHHPLSELALDLPLHPFGAKCAMIAKELRHRNDRYNIGMSSKKTTCQDFLPFSVVTY